MDRDKRWERVKIAVDGLVQGEGEQVVVAEGDGGGEAAVKTIRERYEKKETDEFLKPIIISKEGRIKGGYSIYSHDICDIAKGLCRRRYTILLQLSL